MHGNRNRTVHLAYFNVTLTRIIRPFIMNFYIPSGILVAASWISFFIPKDVIPGR